MSRKYLNLSSMRLFIHLTHFGLPIVLFFETKLILCGLVTLLVFHLLLIFLYFFFARLTQQRTRQLRQLFFPRHEFPPLHTACIYMQLLSPAPLLKTTFAQLTPTLIMRAPPSHPSHRTFATPIQLDLTRSALTHTGRLPCPPTAGARSSSPPATDPSLTPLSATWNSTETTSLFLITLHVHMSTTHFPSATRPEFTIACSFHGLLTHVHFTDSSLAHHFYLDTSYITGTTAFERNFHTSTACHIYALSTTAHISFQQPSTLPHHSHERYST